MKDNDRRGMMIGGLITFGVGLIFLLERLDVIPDIGRMWPLFPMIVGAALIIGSFRKNPEDQEQT